MDACLKAGMIALITATAFSPICAQERPFPVGNPLGLPVAPAVDGGFKPISANVKVYGSVYSAESCTYDAERGVLVVPNRGVPPSIEVNNAWITLLNHDGSVHTSRWLGLQNAGAQRDTLTPPLRLNEPYGSDLVNGVLYLADREGGTNPNDPIISVIHGLRYQQTGDTGQLELQTQHLNRSLRQLTGDGTSFPPLRCPESYYRENGEWGPNDITPLLWTQANLRLALHFMEQSLEVGVGRTLA